MIKFLRQTKRLAALLVALLVFTPMAAISQGAGSGYYFWWQVVDERGNPFTGQNVQCSVFRPNTHAAILLHTTSGFTAGGNSPIWSDPTGKLHFYSAIADPVDVACYYTNGGAAFINDLDRQTHTIIIDRQGRKVSRFAINNTATATNQTPTPALTLPAGAIVRDVLIQNLNPRGLGTYHISVGFAGNHAVAANVNALVDAMALTSPDEWIRPHLVLAVGNSLGNYGVTAAGNHRGVALSQYHQSLCLGGVCGSTTAGITMYRETPYLVHVASGLDVVYAVNPGTAAATRVHVYIFWEQYHSGINRLGRTD